MGLNQKAEEELAMSIKKALAADNSGPKQKHVRSIILYTWDAQGSGSFWTALKTYPVLGDDNVIVKALIMCHKVIRQGHPQALKDGIQEKAWLDTMARMSGRESLARGYVDFLKVKLDFHKAHPLFSGTMDYEEYVSLRGVDDPDEGYETISNLLNLLAKLDAFQKIIFANIRGAAIEARVAALIPLIEESFGIYLFIVAMMSAMHQIIGSVEVLAPLRDQFKRNHYALLAFYGDCSSIRYITTLITIPSLPQDPIDFLSDGQPTKPPKASKPPQKNDDVDKLYLEQQRLLEDNQRREHELELQRQEQESYLQRQEADRLQQLEFERLQRQEQERFLLQQQQHEQQMIQSRLMDASSQIEYLRQQNAQDRHTIEQYNMKVLSLEQQLASMALKSKGESETQAALKKVKDELNQWKVKYESLAKLYAQLRKEHLDLLKNYKALKDSGNKGVEDAQRENSRLKQDLKTKEDQYSEILIERNRLRGDTDRVRLQYEEELARVRYELDQGKAALSEISSTKGAEVEHIVSRFTAEQQQLENIIQTKQKEILAISSKLQDMMDTMEKQRLNYEEEHAVLQESLDQALVVLGKHQQESQSGIGTRDLRISELEARHGQLLNQMMDNVLQACISTLSDTLFMFDSPGDVSSKSNPDYVLSLIEKAVQACSECGASFIRLTNGGDPKDAINTSTHLAQAVSQILQNGKYVYSLATEEEDGEDILKFLHDGGRASIEFFEKLKSSLLHAVQSGQKADYILNSSRTTQHQIGKVSQLLEKLVQSKLAGKLETDLSQVVEREMEAAARAIEEAGMKLASLLSKQPDLDVNSAILQSAMALTSAVANLIKAATKCQEEIVSKGKGSHTIGAFYKKNNKWTDGLISAAQSVAQATTYLCQTADGLIQGTCTLEQLAVSAQEVGVSTTQLVAASRVKADQHSKTQDRLEDAAKAVREATKLLVKAAKEAAALTAENQAREEIRLLSKHDAKVKEMEQSVLILELEKKLQTARYQLGEMRRQGYHQE